MNEEFEKSPSRLAYEREVFTGMSDPADWSPETKSHMEMFFRIWDMAWQASRKQALEDAAATCDEVAAKGAVFVAGLFAAQACSERIQSLQKE